MFRRPGPDRPPTLPSTPLCELRVSAFDVLPCKPTHAYVRQSSRVVPTESRYRPLISVTSRPLFSQPISFQTLTNAYRCFRPDSKSPVSPTDPSPNIPFRITSFAYLHPITLIESHLYEIRGRGWGKGVAYPLCPASEIEPQHPSVTLGCLFFGNA